MLGSGDNSSPVLPQLANVKNARNNNMSTIQHPTTKTGGKPKSKLQDYHSNQQPQDPSGGYEEEDFDSGDGSPPHLKINKHGKK